MKIKCYAVLDAKARAFSQPFYALTDEVAARMFSAAVDDPDTNLAKHPEDYSLYAIGEFDDALGLFVDDESQPGGPRLLAHATNLKGLSNAS